MAGAGVTRPEVFAYDNRDHFPNGADEPFEPAVSIRPPDLRSPPATGSPRSGDLALAFLAPLIRRLLRWAHGRVPASIRPRWDTEDLVQDALVGLLESGPLLVPQDAGAIHSYLRVSIRNRIVDELRRAATEVKHLRLRIDEASPSASPLEITLARDERVEFTEALLVLQEGERLLVTGRLELGFSYADLAEALGYRSSDAVRMATKRAVLKIGKLMEAARSKRQTATASTEAPVPVMED